MLGVLRRCFWTRRALVDSNCNCPIKPAGQKVAEPLLPLRLCCSAGADARLAESPPKKVDRSVFSLARLVNPSLVQCVIVVLSCRIVLTQGNDRKVDEQQRQRMKKQSNEV